MKTKNDESIKIAYKKLCEIQLQPNDFSKNGNYGWWLNAIDRLKKQTKIPDIIEFCKIMLQFINDIDGVIKYTIQDYLLIITKNETDTVDNYIIR